MVLLRHMKGPLEEPRLGRSRRPVRRNVTVAATGQASVSGNALVAKHPEAFSYDADGNLTQDGRWHYTWDGENRLVRMSSANTNPAVGPQQWVEFEYDWQGRRISKKVGAAGSGVATNDLRFVYDGWNLLAILTSDFSLLTSFTWGLDLSGTMEGAGGVGGLLWMTVPSGANAGTYFYAYDGNGNVMALVSAADGSVAARYEYGPFGELIRATGPMAKVNPFRFSTKYQDEETGLVYYGYRYEKDGGWLSRDPLDEKGGFNLYGFVGNDPVGNSDPLGRSLFSLRLFIEWLTGWNGVSPNPSYNYRTLEWSHFDYDGSTASFLKQRWIMDNRSALRALCENTTAGDTKVFNFAGTTVESSFFNSKEPWISAYQARARVLPVHSMVAITKHASCCCSYFFTLQLSATDTADFNPGDRFGPWGVFKDDWFIWVRNHTPFGYDYLEGALKQVDVSLNDCRK